MRLAPTDPAAAAAATAPASSRPRVAMIVNNPCIRHPMIRDARVIREAEALAAAGFEVRVFCRTWRDADVPPLEVINGVAYARFGTAAPSRSGRPTANAPASAAAPARLVAFPSPSAAAPVEPMPGLDPIEPQQESPEPTAEADEKRSLLSPVRRGFRSVLKALRRAKRATRRRLREVKRATRRSIRDAKRATRRSVREARRALRQQSRQLVNLGPRKLLRRWMAPTRRCRQVEAEVLSPLLAFGPEIVHAHDLDTLPAAAQAASALGARLVYDAHEIEIDRMPPRPWLHRLQIRSLEKRFIEQADAFVTVSAGLLRHYGGEYRVRRPLVLYNTPAFSAADRATGDVRSDCGIGPDTWLGVYVGAVGPGRGVETLLEGLARVPGAHLAMVGSRRPQWDELIDRMAAGLGLDGRLHRLPAVPPQHVVSYIASADFGIYTMQDTCLNHRYAMPNKIFEMTFAGLPIVGPDLPGIRAYIDEAGVGFCVDPDDPEAIAAGIRRMAAEWRQFRPGEVKLRQLAAEYGWAHQAAGLVALYRALAEEQAARPGRALRRATA